MLLGLSVFMFYTTQGEQQMDCDALWCRYTDDSITKCIGY